MTTRSFFVFSLIFAACTAANGAVVELKNGDRITGRILGKDRECVHIKADLLGKVDIPRSSIAKIQEDLIVGASDRVSLPPVAVIGKSTPLTAPKDAPKPVAPKPEAQPAVKQDAAPAVAAPTPVVAAASSNVTAPVTAPSPKGEKQITGRKYVSHTIVSFLRRINILDKWKSSLRVGYNLYSGETDSFSNTVNFLTERLWKKSEFRLEFLQDYATSTDTDGEETVSRDKLKVTGRYRYNINHKKMFFQSESQYGYARVNGIDQDYLQSFGYGWRLKQTEIWYFCLVPSLSAQYQVIDGRHESAALSPTLYEEAEYKWSDTLLIRNEAYAIMPVNGDNEPTYHFSALLKNKLVGNISLNIEYVFDFDGSVAKSKDSATQSLNFAFGIDF